ncbi:hypothetical protein HYH03_010387 [Edaphochlamys debaryana]|uniref:GST N-terminal domain-containing protein n=1 Tax=Edaphochlamys debaryana TaxID=47281 RepID=A0A835XVY1_9CHLO|nr:hypothetical protein HYH03_010387 [Edaphochlamys debaryana]|eukprot:KAG2491176.1 hypothetical protein HYH03_010387 [Edaphochlamys debaryana]
MATAGLGMAPTAGADGSPAVRLYVDLMSQPSRAVVIFAKINKLPVEVRNVFIHKGETRAPAFLAINPMGKVPALEDTRLSPPLCLPESGAIMGYLARSFPDRVPEHWFPRADPAAAARVESALHWYHANIRIGAMRLAWNKVVAGMMGQKGDDALAADGAKVLQMALANLQAVWLGNGSRRFIGGSQPCAADLLCACELEQLQLLRKEAHGTSLDEILTPYPVVRTWLDDVRRTCGPEYGEGHKVLGVAVAAQAAKAKAKM